MILTIGGFDAIPYLEQDNFNISCSPQFDTSNSFTTLDGVVHGERYNGDIVTIKADLRQIPTAKAEALSAIFAGETFSVTYTDPLKKTAVFKKPELSAVCSFEGDSTEYWDYSFTLTSLLVPCSDTDSL